MKPPVNEPVSARPVDAVCDAFVEAYAAADPVIATELGLPGHDGEVTDLSPGGFLHRGELLRRTLADARAAEPTDERERAAKEAFLERLGLELERYEAGIPQSEVSVISSRLHDLRTSFDLMETGSEAGWRAVDSRLAGVPGALADYRRTLLESAAEGRVSAKRQYAEVAGQVRGWTGQDGSPSVFSTLVDAYESGPPDGALATDLRRHADEATEAVAAFGRFLETELAPRGRDLDAVGEEHYALASRYFLGAQVDLRETYTWAWDELLRIEQEMQSVASAVQPGASVEEVAERLDARMADAERRLDGSIAHRALVRYDAYGELSGHQSISLALLDSHRNGVVLSSIAHRDTARLYCRQVVDGRGEHELSPEEDEAIRLALTGEAQRTVTLD